MVTSQQEKPNSNWLIKPRSVTLFTTASAIVMLSGALLLFLYLADTKTISALETSTVFRAFAGLGGVVAAPSAIYLFVGMLWYWAKFDSSPTLYKALWFILFLVTGFLALTLYSILIYRRQVTGLIVASG